jgi:hypothetical protein
MNIIFSVIKGDWESVKQSIGNILNAIWNVIQSVFTGIWNTIKSIFSGIKDTASSYFNGIKNIISSVVDGIKNTVKSKFNFVKEAMEKPIQKARDTIKGMIDKIKGFFANAKLEFPNIKLPHIKIDGKLSLSPPSVPKLSIDWYAKAMNNPMVLNDPTIFGYSNASGKYLGAGDGNGNEVVSGESHLMKMIGSAVENKVSGMTQVLYSVLLDILNAIVSGNEDMLRALLNGQTIKIGEREFGRLVREYA